MSLRDVERAMIVFEYFFDKMEIFGPRMNEMAAKKMEDMEEVRLSVCRQSTCKLVSVMPTPFLSFIPRNLYPRNLYPSPSFLTPSLVHSFWLSVSATMPDCGTERTMKRECLHSLWPLWDCREDQHNSGKKSNGTHLLPNHVGGSLS